jgi:hypothetical protein
MVFKPIIIIGAPRSGTNMLRDVLTSLSEVDTWPCDEINYIWRHGNVGYPSDEFTPDMARPEVCNYIRKQFDWVARKYRVYNVVEKTCANSLRVGFINRVVPDANYIFIRRDGLDAIGSTIKRWKAKPDILYLVRKARFVPLMDLPYYTYRFSWNWLYRLLSKEERLAFWGPRLDGMNNILQEYSLAEVCALQWKRCIDKAAAELEKIPRERCVEVEYEKFVTEPELRLKEILKSLDIQASDNSIAKAVSGVSPHSIGKGRKELGEKNISRLIPLIQKTLIRYGYF